MRGLIHRLFYTVFQTLCQPGTKKLTASDLQDLLARVPSPSTVLAISELIRTFAEYGVRIGALENRVDLLEEFKRNVEGLMSLAPITGEAGLSSFEAASWHLIDDMMSRLGDLSAPPPGPGIRANSWS